MGQPDRDFTLRQLRTFICAARAGSFSHAAAELGISQPAVSDQIALLEDRLGHTLFVRRLGTTPKLTAEGIKLLETAGTLIDTSQSMRCEEVKRQTPHVRICIGPRVLELYLKPMLPSLYLDFPGLSIDLVPQTGQTDIRSALERGRIDLAVYTLEAIPAGWQNCRMIGEIMMVMAGPPGTRQRLASGDVEMNDLQFILPTAGKMLENRLEKSLRELGVNPRKPIIFLEFADVIQRMVEDGQGVTMLSYEQLAGRIAAGRLEIFGPALNSLKRVVARSDHASHAARVIEERLIKAMTGPPPGMARI
ncbi:MAG: LysR family transcriptional regulator [Sphingobium sp.]|nr:LysR family transcriptional regulator [Sphingobium sp.]